MRISLDAVTTAQSETNPNAKTPLRGVVAITFALPEESKDLVEKLSGIRIIRRGSLPVIAGELAGKQVVICHTGVGEESCRIQMTGFLQNTHPVALISSGFAGGLDPALKVGDLILARNFSNEELLSRADTGGAVIGVLTSQAEVAETVSSKSALAAKTGASAVDMETAIISEMCAKRGIPMLSLRGISDAATDNLPVSFGIWFDASEQKPRVGALLLELALHPFKIPAFAKFVNGISFARLRLTETLLKVIEKL